MVYVFGDYVLDTRTCELQHAGQPVSLTPKVYQVLVYLLEHCQRFVPTAELLEHVWPDTYVDDSAVKRCIAMARRALGDRSAASQWIKTVRGQGYRFVAAVSSSESVAPGVTKCAACAQEVVLPAAFCAACGQPLPVTPAPLPAPLSPPRPGLPGRARHPFVGRQPEIAMLQDRLAQVERGRGQVIGILGEPGMGKSRLLYEWQQWLGSRQVTYWHGACQPYGQAVPYLPLHDLLCNAWHITPTDSPAVIAAKVRAGLLRAGAEPEAWAPCLLHLLGGEVASDQCSGWSPEQLKAHTFAALHQVLLPPARQRPGVLALEDAHWIDATSEAYLVELVERLARTPYLLLVTFRPGYQPAWLNKSYATQLALPPLAAEDSRQVMHAVLGPTSLHTGIEQQLLRKAAGNPFFLEELAYTVAEQGTAAAALSVPDTIQAVIAARLDRLPPLDKRLLHVAAVVDAEVPLSLLQGLVGLPTDIVQGSLRRLQASEFLYETRLLPELTYTFKHALTQEVAYSQVPPEQRRSLHRQIVQALESLAAERLSEQADLLARHALRGEMWEAACHYFRHAGQRALGRSAYREAGLCFEQALSGLQHLPDSRATQEQAIDLRLDLRNALLPLGENGRCLDVLREAEACALSLDDAQRLGWIACYTSVHAFVLGDYAPAVTAGQRALALALACEDSDLQSATYLRLGQAYHAMGEYGQARAMLQSNITPLDDHMPAYFGSELAGLPTLHSRVWQMLCLAELGAFAEGRQRGAEAMRIATAVARPYSLLMACTGLGLLDLRQGDLASAVAHLERALKLCQEADATLVFPAVATHLGMAYSLAGRLSAALPLLEQAVAQATARHLLVSQPQAVLALGEASLRAGHLQEAESLATQALALCQQHGAQGVQAWTLRLLGEIAAQRQPLQVVPTVQWYQQALALAETLAMQPLAAHCHLGLRRVYTQTGHADAAQTALSTAAAGFRAMAMPYWLTTRTGDLE